MKLFVINLKTAEERRNRVTEQLSKLGVEFEFFDAVNGFAGLPSELADKPDDDYRRKFRSRPLTPGEKGVYASHYLLWQKCVELNQAIAIFEDDFLPTPFFKQVFEKLPELHQRYDYLRLEPQDSNFNNRMIENTPEGFQILMWMDNAGGARGYSLTPKAAKQFIQESQRWQSAVDNFIGEPYRHKIPALGLIPYAVFNPSDMESQIQGIVKKTSVPIYFKLLRELSRFSRFIRLSWWNHVTSKQTS